MSLTRRLADLLAELCALPGVSGNESRVGACLSRHLAGAGGCTGSDRFGNVLAWFRIGAEFEGPDGGEQGAGAARRPLLIAAHTDEKGLFVRRVCDDGLIVFDPSGFDRRCLPAQAVEVHGRKGPVAGVIQAGLGFRAGAAEVPDPGQMRIEVGAASAGEATEQLGIRTGDPITFQSPLVGLHGGMVMSRALDNRAGCAAAIAALDAACPRLAGPVVVAGTRQEESGLRGAGPAARSVDPDAAIIADVISGDVYDLDPQSSRAMLGRGVIIHYDPGTDRAMHEYALQVAAAKGITHQVQAMSGIGADARPIGEALTGVPVLSLFCPTLHFHSPRALLRLSDLAAMAQLLEALICDPGFFATFRRAS